MTLWPEPTGCVSGPCGQTRPRWADEGGRLETISPRISGSRVLSAGCLASAAAMLPAASGRAGESRERAPGSPAPPGGCSRVRAAGGRGRPRGSRARRRLRAHPSAIIALGLLTPARVGNRGTGAAPFFPPRLPLGWRPGSNCNGGGAGGVWSLEGWSGRDEVGAPLVRPVKVRNFGVPGTFQSAWDRAL